jgi:hypothetical protein
LDAAATLDHDFDAAHASHFTIILATNSKQAGGMVPRNGQLGAGSDKAWPL